MLSTWFIPSGLLFLGITFFTIDHNHFSQFMMSVLNKEARLILAIEVIKSSKKNEPPRSFNALRSIQNDD